MKYFFYSLTYLIASGIYAQDWIPQGKGMLTAGHLILSISVVNDSVIWATASESSVVTNQQPVPPNHLIKVLRSVDGGETWERHSVEEAAGNISWDIMADDANTAWITTTPLAPGDRTLYKTVNGGLTWTSKLTNDAVGVAVRRFDDQHLFVQTNDAVAYSSNNGETWSLDTIHEYLPDEFNTLAAGTNMVSVHGDTLWVGTTLGRVVRFTNYGASYEMIYTGSLNSIVSLSFADHLHGMIAYYNFNSGAFGLMRTQDGGNTWIFTPSKPETDFFYNVHHVPGTENTFVAVTNFFFNRGEYFGTTDFGNTWIKGGEIQDGHTNAVQFLNTNLGWVSTGNILTDSDPVAYKWNDDAPSGIKNEFRPLAGFILFPSPATNSVQYNYDEKTNGPHLETVTDLEGRTHSIKNTADCEIDISHLPAGIYFLNVQDNDRSGSLKFVKLP